MARVGLCRLNSEGVATVQKKYRAGRWGNIAAFCANIGIPRSTYYELIGRNVWFEQATLEDKLAAIGIAHADYERLCEFKDRELDALLQRMGSHATVCAFLMTDIEGSVRLWEAHPAAMRSALTRHDTLLQQTIHRHQGRVFKTVGDGVYAAFAAAPAALAAALAAQQALIAEPWSLPIKVRMALHFGEAEERDGDYFGHTLSRISRLLAIGHGGQILLTQVTCDAAQEHLPAGTALRDMHTHRLRDIQEPEHVWQLLHPALPPDFPPLRSLQAFANNLPTQPTSFIGRERETVQIKSLLQQTRLLTLIGAGGCGKTRLALQVAADLLEAYPDGVWQIELAPLADPTLVEQTVATTLGLREQPVQPLMQTLTDYLRGKTTLLLLDNCEHLIVPCAQLADALLHTCPTVTLLATSREALHIAGESVWRVPSLSPPAGDVLPQEEPEMVSALLGSDAVRLFVERARSQRPDFALTRQNGPLVAGVCRRLDGIPLAIELAAARVRVLTMEQLSARLDRCFHLLTGGNRMAAPRQQTIRALIDWSYDLLEAAEKTLLARLSVFVGGWTLEAAGTVCAGVGIADWEGLDLLTSLTDKSLVVFEERFGAGRYRLLETIRQYAQERLGSTEEPGVWRVRHRNYFLTLAEEINPKLNGPEQAQWLDVLEEEHDNLRQVLTLCAEDAEDAEAGEKGLRLGAALQGFWRTRGHLREGRERLRALLAHPGGQEPTKARAEALNGAGGLAWMQGDYAQACVLHEESLAIQRQLGDRSGIALSLLNLGNVAQVQGDFAAARTLYEESLAIRRELGNKGSIAYDLEAFASLAVQEAQEERGVCLWGAAATLREAIGSPLPPAEHEKQEREMTVVQETLGEATFAAAWEQGRSMTWEQAIEYAIAAVAR